MIRELFGLIKTIWEPALCVVVIVAVGAGAVGLMSKFIAHEDREERTKLCALFYPANVGLCVEAYSTMDLVNRKKNRDKAILEKSDWIDLPVPGQNH